MAQGRSGRRIQNSRSMPPPSVRWVTPSSSKMADNSGNLIEDPESAGSKAIYMAYFLSSSSRRVSRKCCCVARTPPATSGIFQPARSEPGLLHEANCCDPECLAERPAAAGRILGVPAHGGWRNRLVGPAASPTFSALPAPSRCKTTPHVTHRCGRHDSNGHAGRRRKDNAHRVLSLDDPQRRAWTPLPRCRRPVIRNPLDPDGSSPSMRPGTSAITTPSTTTRPQWLNNAKYPPTGADPRRCCLRRQPIR